MAGRRRFSWVFKLYAVNLVTQRGGSAAQAARDLGVQSSVLRAWVWELRANSTDAFPGQGKQKREDAVHTRLRREVAHLQVERNIP